MQAVSPEFIAKATGDMADISWGVKASFDKAYDPSISFFTLDVSILDGSHILAASSSDVIAEWDKYEYTDYSDRVISLEVSREVVEPDSIVQAYADVTFKNEDDFFTPNSGSPIDQFILPKRPFRLLMGFGGELVQTFVGLSEKMPTIDKRAGTATFHLIDFLSLIFDREIGDTEMLLNYSTSEILSYLFQEVGLLPNQFVLDTSFNRIPFFSVTKGTKLGSVVRELMQAEQGRLYLDELGMIRFLNRQNYPTSPVISFDKDNTHNYSVSDEDDIINYAKFNADILAVMSEQSIWQSSGAQFINVGQSVDIWADLNDPATSVTNPISSSIQIPGSYFSSTTDEAGEIPYSGISLSAISKFGTAVKMTFTNGGLFAGYVSAIDLWGTPVKVIDTILAEDFDQDSIDKFEERVYEFKTRYIQTYDNALSKAAIMVQDHKDYGSIVDLDVQGTPALQIDDMAVLDLDGYQGNHVISKIVQGMEGGEYWQRLRAKSKDVNQYFILDVSLLNGTDILAP